MRVNPNNIAPSQDFLKPKTVEFIFNCIEKGALDNLPPAPIVRKDERDNLIAIDGHNLIAVKSFLKESVDVHLATSSTDGLPETSEANISRNSDLKEKFDTVLEDRERLKEAGTNTFKDLITKYPDLFQ